MAWKPLAGLYGHTNGCLLCPLKLILLPILALKSSLVYLRHVNAIIGTKLYHLLIEKSIRHYL